MTVQTTPVRWAVQDPEWETRAACTGLTDWQQIFFPAGSHGSDGAPNSYDRARRICNGCPVTQDCLHAAMREEAHAQGRGGRIGMRGGRTPAERYELAGVKAPGRRRGGL